MKSGFTKYVPITEAEYRKFREQQNRQLLQAQQELQLAPAMKPLSTAQDEKIHTLFSAPLNVEEQEKRFMELTHIINQLKRKVEQQSLPAATLPKAPRHSVINPNVVSSGAARDKATQLLTALGTDTWDETDNLVVDGESIPDSNKSELLNYVVSNWRTKYKHKKPKGAEAFEKLLRDKNISSSLLGHRFNKVATGKVQKRKKRQTLQKMSGEDILSDAKLFKRLMRM